ncbi:MAG: exodeoxyribonuclease III [Gammaproteobacteria bacterium]|nr:exodeoxyribonuclease III [Gammaproteobacteria bacterium]
MKIATWNVNSFRVRLPHVREWLAARGPDVLGLQETKVEDEKFPLEEIRATGYEAVFSGQRTYNGVALLAREPAADVVTDPFAEDEQRRVIVATVGGVRVVNLYVPNGQEIGSEKFDYKLRWLERLDEYLTGELREHERLVVIGDLNIAPEERDCHDPDLWAGHVLFSEPERAAFRRLLDVGLCDTFRLFEQEPGQYTWWDYRMQAFRRNHGLRIDHILASRAMCDACRAGYVDTAPRKLQRPSDHAPVIAEFAF